MARLKSAERDAHFLIVSCSIKQRSRPLLDTRRTAGSVTGSVGEAVSVGQLIASRIICQQWELQECVCHLEAETRGRCSTSQPDMCFSSAYLTPQTCDLNSDSNPDSHITALKLAPLQVSVRTPAFSTHRLPSIQLMTVRVLV